MSEPATSRPPGYPQPDHDAVLKILQEQLDELLAATRDQQAAIGTLTRRVLKLEQRPGPSPGP
jgi:hypothetical protein